jgi:putative DNA primase/helicase
MRDKDIDIDEPIIADGKLHRYHVAGDRKRVRNAWAILHLDDRPAGQYGCNKRYAGEKFSWVMESARALTPNERETLRRTAAARAEQRQCEIEMQQAEAAQRALRWYNAAEQVTEHPYLVAKGVPPSEKLRVGNWYYLDEDTGEEVLSHSNALIVPMMDPSKRIHSLQGIMLDDEGNFQKRYLKNGAKEGHLLAIGRPRDNAILICEGLATGLSLWQCTEDAIIVAFDSVNLIHVAREVRRVFPAYRVLICADNDAWTEKPIKNPGLHYANEAALAIAADVVYPEFFDTATKPTDFNDLHALEGEVVVREMVLKALAPPPALSPGDLPRGDEGEELGRNPHFVILGYDHGVFYFFQHEQGQIVSYTKSDMNDNGFIFLAPLNWWEEHFNAGNGGIHRKSAVEFLMRTANKRGIFNPDSIRGRGAWIDNGRVVFHHGEYLFVDGNRTELTKITSKYVYEASPMLFQCENEELSDDEGRKILELVKTWNWEIPAHAALVVGWILLAPICGALQWRPHVWVSGGSGTGKTTLMEKIVFPLLRGIAVFAIANSTEAGIRQQLRCDARPVIFDEAEGGDDRADARIKEIMSLMRQASSDTGAHIFKGTQGGRALRFSCRAMFLMPSIRAPVMQEADVNRITVLSLRPLAASADQEEETLGLIDAVARDERIGARLIKRVLSNLSVIKKNIGTFARVAARSAAKRRDADQIGALVAGAWAMTSRQIVTDEEAAKFLESFAWRESRGEPSVCEGEAVLQTMMRQRVRDSHNREVVVAEFVAAVAGKGILDGSAEDADRELQGHGLRVIKRDSTWKLLVAKGHAAVRVLTKGSGFESDPWRQLERIKGARKSKAGEPYEKVRFARNPCRYVEIPMECVLGEDWEAELVTTDPSLVKGEELFVSRHPRASELQ